MYIYSDTDGLVEQKAVPEHIAKAKQLKQLGLNVKGECFKGSVQVLHVRAHADRYYWTVVEESSGKRYR
jgi:hypothetical protein